MLKALLRIQFLSLAGYMFKGRHRTKKRSPLVTALIALLAVYIVAVICLYFGMLFISICEPFYSMGLGWLYFSFAGLTAFAVCFITGIFIAQSQLFDAKDNELLLSLPISPKYIPHCRPHTHSASAELCTYVHSCRSVCRRELYDGQGHFYRRA